jgi:hypothetical protein
MNFVSRARDNKSRATTVSRPALLVAEPGSHLKSVGRVAGGASMGSVGDALDNAHLRVADRHDEDREAQPAAVALDRRPPRRRLRMIETWCNRRRRHSSLGMLSPDTYENRYREGHRDSTRRIENDVNETGQPQPHASNPNSSDGSTENTAIPSGALQWNAKVGTGIGTDLSAPERI